MGKKWILLVSFLVLILFGGYRIYEDSRGTILELPVISREKAEKLKAERSAWLGSVQPELDGAGIAAMGEPGGYLLPQKYISGTDGYTGTLTSAAGFRLYVIEPEHTKEELMGQGIPLQILACKGGQYQEFSITLTNLPVLSIESDRQEEENTYGTMTLIDPRAQGSEERIDVWQRYCRYHVRGASSRLLDKKSFKLNLLTRQGSAKDSALLGMRKDNDWILNAMATDHALVRERLAYDLWDRLSDVYQHEMNYVELILDGEYQGVYALQEPVDYQTFSGNAGTDFLYYIKGKLKDEYRQIDQDEFIPGKEMVDEFELITHRGTDYARATQLLRELFHSMRGEEEGAYTFSFDQENCVDYLLLINLIEAADNYYKNEKFYLRYDGSGAYSVVKTPWDLDICFAADRLEGRLQGKRKLKDEFLPDGMIDDP